MNKSKCLPLLLCSVFSAVLSVSKTIADLLWFDGGAYKNGKVFVNLLTVLLPISIAVCIFFIFKTLSKRNAQIGFISDFPSVFSFFCTGFFNLFTAAFIFYSVIQNKVFFEGSMLIFDLLLAVASIGTAALCFIKALGKETDFRKNHFYCAIYLFPTAWAMIRLFVTFIASSSKALSLNQKLGILSLIVLTVYFLYEVRIYHSQISLRLYAVICSALIIIVPFSALSSSIISLVGGASLGEPILRLNELSICAFAASNLLNALKNKEGIENEN